MTKSELAVSKFLDGYNCAQSVFFAFSEDVHLESHIALKMACGFGAGMGRKGEVCGAVTGGILVLNAKYGRIEKDDLAAQELTYLKTRELMDSFALKHSTYICRDLLKGCDLTTEEGRTFFKENDIRRKTCVPCIQTVVRILEEIMGYE